MKRDSFYWVCGVLVLFVLGVLSNQWFKILSSVYLDKYTVLLIFTVIGISLLPFADKIKIGNILEIERLNRKIDEVKLTQYLGEIIRSEQGDIFYYDSEGRHELPDLKTANFLKTNRGEMHVTKEVLDQMKVSYKMDSVMTARKVKWRKEHIFVILNGKKFHISSWSHIADWESKESDFEEIEDDGIRLIPTGR